MNSFQQKIIKHCLFLLLIFFSFQNSYCQNIKKIFFEDSLSSKKLIELKAEFGNNKSIPPEYEKQILTALSFFPELKNIKIKFRIKETTTPLASRPTLTSLFINAKNRTYLVTISNKTNDLLSPILFQKLNYNAQIGVLGHEISHISDYSHKGFFKMLSIVFIEIFSKKQVDKFEYRTDEICIEHGLGYQLLDWSLFVRGNLKRQNWRGASDVTQKGNEERYLNPSTIRIKIKNNEKYKN